MIQTSFPRGCLKGDMRGTLFSLVDSNVDPILINPVYEQKENGWLPTVVAGIREGILWMGPRNLPAIGALFEPLFLGGEGSPSKIDYRKNRVPTYSNLSTG